MSKENVERRKKLRKAAKRKQKMNDADPWEPAEGEMIEGEYLGSRITNKFGETPIYYIEMFDGGVVSVLGRTSMKMAMDRNDPEPGDLIAVTFEGMQNTPDSQGEFYAYDVTIA